MSALDVRPGRSWTSLFDVPAGPRTRVSAAVARQLMRAVAARHGIDLLAPGTTPKPDALAAIVLYRPDEFYARVGRDGLIGFGEGYMAGAWDSPDLFGLLSLLATDIGGLVPARLQQWRRWYVARQPRAHRGLAGNARNNVAHHYDLSNDLFAAFLDETMTYSSAYFADTPEPTRADLARAQIHKIERLLDRARVGPGARLLEIGTGWGQLAIRAAHRGATVHSVTLSSQQRSLALERVAAAGLADRVRIDLADYREVTGSYDAVVSVEMIEAVGREFLPAYFQVIRDRLRRGGRAALQAIVMPHDRMLATAHNYTWIHKYIFPGGFLPSSRLIGEYAAAAGLLVVDRTAFGSSYAQTLRLWDEAFLATDIAPLGFDEVFRRMWHFYLTYSRAGFASGYLDVEQVTLARP